jgi:hypothetical protein
VSGLPHASAVCAALPAVVLVGRLVRKSTSQGPRAVRFCSGDGGVSQVPAFSQQPTLRLSVVFVALKSSAGLARKYFHFGGYVDGTLGVPCSLATKSPAYWPRTSGAVGSGPNGQICTW